MSIVERASQRITEIGGVRNSEGEQRQPLTHASELVTIDFVRLRRLGLVTPSSYRTRQAEEFRLIKRRLRHRIEQRSGHQNKDCSHNVVVVTSARPNEGKTFTSLCLSIVLGLSERERTLLVDADLLRPSVAKTLGLKLRSGLIEHLADTHESNPFIAAADNINLDVLAAGGANKHVPELFSSNKVSILLRNLSRQYHTIIVDTPPILAANEAALLARAAGEVLMVVDSTHTPPETIKNALDLLDHDDDKVSFVLNRCLPGITDHFGAYYR